jgi:hypothetical protein
MKKVERDLGENESHEINFVNNALYIVLGVNKICKVSLYDKASIK